MYYSECLIILLLVLQRKIDGAFGIEVSEDFIIIWSIKAEIRYITSHNNDRQGHDLVLILPEWYSVDILVGIQVDVFIGLVLVIL